MTSIADREAWRNAKPVSRPTSSQKEIVWIALVAIAAVALATTLWAGSTSAQGIQQEDDLIHQSENQNLCFNVPYQNFSNGTRLVVNLHCDWSDRASKFHFRHYQSQDFQTVEASMGKCMDNLYGVQQELNPVVIWDCNGGGTQKWNWDGGFPDGAQLGGGAPYFWEGVFHYHPNPNMCLSVQWGDFNSEGHLVLAHCNGQGNQRFVIRALFYSWIAPVPTWPG